MQQQEGQNNLYVWTVMEEGIEGKCENTYQVTEIPEYMVHDYEKGMFQPELCQGKKFWQVLRTRDITKCTDRSVFLSSKGHKNCVVGNCETENSKQTQTRYFACGLTAEDMQLHGMINEGERVMCTFKLRIEEADFETFGGGGGYMVGGNQL